MRQHHRADGDIGTDGGAIAVDRLVAHRIAESFRGDDQRMLVAIIEDGAELVARKRAEHVALPHPAQDALAGDVDHPVAGLITKVGVDAANVEHGNDQKHRRAPLGFQQLQSIVEALQQLVTVEPPIRPVETNR